MFGFPSIFLLKKDTNFLLNSPKTPKISNQKISGNPVVGMQLLSFLLQYHSFHLPIQDKMDYALKSFFVL